MGVDLSDLALRLCRSRSVDEGRGEGAALGSRRPELVCGELARLPFAECSFDLVTMFDVLYHKWVEDDEAALREMARVCRPGGWILITDSAMPFLRGPHDEAYGGARRYTRRRLREVVESAGFRVRRMSYFHFFLFPLIAGVRMKERWFSSAGGAKSSLAPIHPALNGILKALSWIESLLLGLVRLPWGSSIICLAERTESGSERAGAGM